MNIEAPTHEFLWEVDEEVGRAREKFPKSKHLALAAAEEAGEAVKAAMDMLQKGGSREDLYRECVQAAAMFLRLAVEGDSSLKIKPLRNRL